jgi:hypothetical protein
MHLEQPQIRFETKWEILTLFEPSLRKFKCLLKIKGRDYKILNIRRLMSLPKPLKLFHFEAIPIW